MVEVSVIIPTICRKEFLVRAVNSVFAQKFSNFEIIIINDSKNETDQYWLVKTFTDGVKIFEQKNKTGANAARNLGIKKSNGKYITFLDDDDEWHPNKLSTQINHMKNSFVGLSYTGKNIIDEKTGKQIWYSFEKPIWFQPNVYIYIKNYIGTNSSIMINKSVFDEIGLFDESLPAIQDYDLFIRVAQKFTISGIDQGLVNYYSDFSSGHISLDSIAYKKAVAILLGKYKNTKFIYLLKVGLWINRIRKLLLQFVFFRNIYGYIKK